MVSNANRVCTEWRWASSGQSVLLILLPAPVLLLLLNVLLLSLRRAWTAWSAKVAGEGLPAPAVLLGHHLQLLSWHGTLVLEYAAACLLVLHLWCVGGVIWWLTMVGTVLVRSWGSCTHIRSMDVTAALHLIRGSSATQLAGSWSLALIATVIGHLTDVRKLLLLLRIVWLRLSKCTLLLCISIGSTIMILTASLRSCLLLSSSYKSTVIHFIAFAFCCAVIQVVRSIALLHCGERLIMVVPFEELLDAWSL